MVKPAPTLQHIAADKVVLSQVFASHKEVLSFINWYPQWSEQKNKWLKRPTQNISNPFEHLSYDDASSKGENLGLVCSDQHNIIAIDIDGVDQQTPSIKALINDNPTYMESSPSGKPNHLRLLYMVSDKALLRRKGSTIPLDQPNDNQAAIELFNSSTNYVTLTGKALTKTRTIAQIDPDTIISLWPSFAPNSTPVIDIHTKQQLPAPANLTPSQTWLDEVPCDRADTTLISFLGKHSLIYHDYWLLGLMAINAAFGPVQGQSIADAWSQKSGDEYDLEELQARWDSISQPNFEPAAAGLPSTHTSVTAGTYQWMFNEFSIQWPVLAGKTKKPKKDELVNFKAFLDYKELTPVVDAMTTLVFLEGDDYAVYPRYYKSKEASYAIKTSNLHSLSARLVAEAEPYNFLPTTNMVMGWLTDIVLLSDDHKINRFAREIASRPEYDPTSEPDYLTLMGTTIIQRNEKSEAPSQEFHELLIRKWLLSLGRNLWTELPFTSTSEGVLILSSPKAGIGKSSFGQRLFPKEWRHLHVTSKPRLSGQYTDKDSIQKTVGKLIVDFDEAERIFNNNDTAELKTYLTQEYDDYRPPYARDELDCKRYFSCLASTNEENLVFPKDGVRRYWWLNVDYVDTYAMDDMDMYDLWRQIRYELSNHKGKMAPYILTASEIAYLTSYLAEHRTTTEAEEALLEVFDFSSDGFAKYNEKRKKGIKKMSMSVREISDTLENHSVHLKLKPLGHSATFLLKQFAPDTMWISNTEIVEGVHMLSRQKRFFMPELRNDALQRAAEEGLME